MIKIVPENPYSKQKADIVSLAQIAIDNQLFVGEYLGGLYRLLVAVIQFKVSARNTKIWILYLDSIPVGIALLGRFSELMFYVKVEHRKKGLAALLLDRVINDPSVDAFQVFQGNNASLKFLKSYGFTVNIVNHKKTPSGIKNRWTARKLKRFKQYGVMK